MMKQNETQTWKAFEKEQLKEECQFISTVLVAQTKNGIYRSNLTLKIFKMNWLQKILVSENIKDGYYCDPGKKDLKNSWAGIGKDKLYRFFVLQNRLSTWKFQFGKLLKSHSANFKKINFTSQRILVIFIKCSKITSHECFTSTYWFKSREDKVPLSKERRNHFYIKFFKNHFITIKKLIAIYLCIHGNGPR